VITNDVLPKRESEDGWTPLEFYAWTMRTLGIPARFTLDDAGQWHAEGPFTKPSPELLEELEAHGV
jgi:hypothetical protein